MLLNAITTTIKAWRTTRSNCSGVGWCGLFNFKRLRQRVGPIFGLDEQIDTFIQLREFIRSSAFVWLVLRVMPVMP
jgi:hypothetical protein